MAHSCPDCGLTCYCNSDIDDIVFDDDGDDHDCTHCVCKKCGERGDDCFCDPVESDCID